MIPRAVEQVFRGTEQMKMKGWEYKMEGQFLEIVRMVSPRENPPLINFFLTVQRNYQRPSRERRIRQEET